ncbi:unnamed protein product [Brachionus calyciflorus]|uniref:Uncharacterized protein n=1 Tax=Brachionus calyciflorus TaxID=104777 RepID=A0A813R178_9BILA|nr:unnamed protein product [Brachionus calyciflorus]
MNVITNSALGFILVICCFGIISSEETAGKEQSVLVHFMDYKKHEFLEQLPVLTKGIADTLNAYCSNVGSKCDYLRPFEFSDKNIKFVGATEKEKFTEDTRFVLGNVYIDTEGSAETKLLPKSFTLEFLKESRDEIVKNGKVEIAYLDHELVFPPRDNLDNWIIISVSCAFCVALIILNLVCQLKISKAQRAPKSKIYNNKESGSNSKISNKSNDEDKEFPLLSREKEANYENNDSPFPIPSTPITSTVNRQINIRTNPNMRYTQV